MFLRQTRRKKDGKTHVYWNIVENRRLDDGRVVQRQVLYLGEINSSQAAAWRKAIEVFDDRLGGLEPELATQLNAVGRRRCAADGLKTARAESAASEQLERTRHEQGR